MSALFQLGNSSLPTGNPVPAITTDPIRLLNGEPTSSLSRHTEDATADTHSLATSQEIQIIFSDVDGTLVHYPADDVDYSESILQLPPSSTGMQGVISAKTLVQCQQIRQKYRRKLVLISGMRTSTLWKRLPFLPRADAYCSEAGRIFYPTTNMEGYHGLVVVPQTYDGCSERDLQPFGLIEDVAWRTCMEQTCGTDGFVGTELATSQDPIPVKDRKGLLWEYARTLMDKGLVIDTEGYSTCFRVNRKQQTNVAAFDALLTADHHVPPELATSMNLGCLDFYPRDSGKKNCCIHLAKELCNNGDVSFMASSALCLCDDDNDLEMALACKHAFVPSVSSESMALATESNPDKITITGGINGANEGTSATERALEFVLERLATAIA